MKSTKYKIHRMSKNTYPTRFVKGFGGRGGNLEVGRTAARAALERNLGRALKEDTVEADTCGEWLFKEPL